MTLERVGMISFFVYMLFFFPRVFHKMKREELRKRNVIAISF